MSEAFIIRHSKANYKSYDKHLTGEKPEGCFQHQEQVGPDLTEAGVTLAQENAKNFFNDLNPNTDELFFVSSNEVRAIDTANIYKETAVTRGFTIIKPENSSSVESKDTKVIRSPYAEIVSKGDIRVLENLSLNTDNLLRFLVFSGSVPTVNWEAIKEDSKNKWLQARQLIEVDNKDSWGGNFVAHSKAVAEILPGVETAQRFYETNFKNLIRLLKWADGKIKKYESENQGKKIKVLAFGHEDFLVQFLKDIFNEEGIKNCEVLSLSTNEIGSVTAGYRKKTKNLE